MKNAIIGRINAGAPNPTPRCISFNGKNPSFASLPIDTATSAPYATSNPIAIPVMINAAFRAMFEMRSQVLIKH